jgi:Short-chain dehydrogenases of various substrate specificities
MTVLNKLFFLFLIRIFSIDAYAQQKEIAANDNVNQYALIAGGSKGIGYAIAEALAKRKYNLILIARHADSLVAAKNKLEKAYNIHVDILKLDLEKESTADSIARWCKQNDIHLKVLCNVAGFGGPRDYLILPLDTLRYMVRLNVESCMALSLTLLPLLEKECSLPYFKCGQHGGVFANTFKKFIFSYKISSCIF